MPNTMYVKNYQLMVLNIISLKQGLGAGCIVTDGTKNMLHIFKILLLPNKDLKIS